MAMRSSWEGFLRLSLISVPVKAYTVGVTGHGKVAFHQLHEKCHSRIRHQKVCPIHGEVTKDEIVSGYEYAKDQYVVVDPKELAELRPGADKSINIDVFISPDTLPPIYFTDRSYYLAPDGKAGQKPYAILHKIMTEEHRAAIGMMVFSGRDHLVLIQPVERVLVVNVLSYEAQVKKPSALDDEIPDTDISAPELKLARTLVEESTAAKFDFSAYEDHYTEKVTQLINATAAGKKLVTSHKSDEPHVINLMDALKQSLKAVKRQASKNGKAPAIHSNGKRHRATAKRMTG